MLLLDELAAGVGGLARVVVLAVARDPLARRGVDGRHDRVRLAAVLADDREQVALAGVAVGVERGVAA